MVVEYASGRLRSCEAVTAAVRASLMLLLTRQALTLDRKRCWTHLAISMHQTIGPMRTLRISAVHCAEALWRLE
jgi:hypothetical protein